MAAGLEGLGRRPGPRPWDDEPALGPETAPSTSLLSYNIRGEEPPRPLYARRGQRLQMRLNPLLYLRHSGPGRSVRSEPRGVGLASSNGLSFGDAFRGPLNTSIDGNECVSLTGLSFGDAFRGPIYHTQLIDRSTLRHEIYFSLGGPLPGR